MEQLTESLRKANTHCGESEYTQLLENINLCRFYSDPIDAAKRSRHSMQKYLSEINLDPVHYSIVEHVSLKNFKYVSELLELRKNYEKITQQFPYDYDKHIKSALLFFELLREGAEIGYVLYGL